MKTLRSIRHVLTDPPSSGIAALLALFFPVVAAGAVVSLLPGVDAPTIARPSDAVWVYALLHVVRQRDQARALAQERGRDLRG